MTTENPTYWSDNEEDWNCDCLSDLLAGNDELKAGDTVYFGTGVTPPATAFINASDVIEMMGERAYDDFGEHAEDFPCVTVEAKEELEAMLSDWVGRHCHPTFYRITDVTEYVLTEEDIQDANA